MEGGESCVICSLVTRPNPLTFLNLDHSRSLGGGGGGGWKEGSVALSVPLLQDLIHIPFSIWLTADHWGGGGGGEGGRGVLRYLFPCYKT